MVSADVPTGYVLKGTELDRTTKESADSCATSCLDEARCLGITYYGGIKLCQRFEAIDLMSDRKEDHILTPTGEPEYSETAVKRQN
jgi:hypothetical protein